MNDIRDSFKPLGVEFREVTGSLRLPPDRVLQDGWNQLQTGEWGSTVTIKISPNEMDISFSPPLEIDVQWPAANQDLMGVTYSFSGAWFSGIRLQNGGSGWDPGDVVENKTRQTVRESLTAMIAGTRVSRPGFKPTNIEEAKLLLEELKRKMSGGTSSSPVQLGDLTGLSTGLSITTTAAIEKPPIRISSGTIITISVNLSGTAKDVADSYRNNKKVKISSADLSSTGIVLLDKGVEVVLLSGLNVSHGNVRVTGFSLLGKAAEDAKEAEKTETALRGLFGMLLGSQMTPLQASQYGSNYSTAPEFVRGLSRAMVESGLKAGLNEFYQKNKNKILTALPPAVDLTEVFE